MPSPQPRIKLFLSLDCTLDELFSKPYPLLDVWDQPNHVYYFSDYSVKWFVQNLNSRWRQTAQNRLFPRKVIELFVKAEDENRLFWMPEGCEPGTQVNVEEHHNTFLVVLSQLRRMGADVPEWNAEHPLGLAHWNWTELTNFLRGQNISIIC